MMYKDIGKALGISKQAVQQMEKTALRKLRALSEAKLSKLDIVRKCTPDPISGCWIWNGCVNNRGYGLVSKGTCGKDNFLTLLAHRASFYVFNGYFPEVCMHACDNPPCVNPDHLLAGTQAANSRDMWGKGRGKVPPQRYGEASNFSKLSSRDVKRIRREVANGRTQTELAKEYGVTRACVSLLCLRRTWVSVE